MQSNKNLLIQYAALSLQLLLGLGLMVYGGIWIDKKIALLFPLFVWLLPLFLIVAMIIKVIKDTTKHP